MSQSFEPDKIGLDLERQTFPCPKQVDREDILRISFMGDIVLECETLEDMWSSVLQLGLDLTGATRAFVVDHERDSPSGEAVIASLESGQESSSDHGSRIAAPLVSETADRQVPVCSPNTGLESSGSLFELATVNPPRRAALCVPVMDARGLQGVMYFDAPVESEPYGCDSVYLAQLLGRRASVGYRHWCARKQCESFDDAEFDAMVDREREALDGLQSELRDLAVPKSGRRIDSDQFPGIAYASDRMAEILEQVQRIARTDISVLVTGESGVGKELIARSIHNQSARADEPFVSLNCGAISKGLIESELFGHREGAFTGASRDKKGMFEAASGGTLFLDEVGEMPPKMQVKLLRTLEESQIRPVGSTETIPVDVRIVAATIRDLEQQVESDKFREDLYFRLAGMTIQVPPLRERRSDIPVIAEHLIGEISKQIGQRVRLEPEATDLLMKARWPGNVRELKNTLRTACGLTDGYSIGKADVAPLIKVESIEANRRARDVKARSESTETNDAAPPSESAQTPDGRGRNAKAKRREVQNALDRADGDLALAASHLDVSKRTMYRYMRKYGLER